MFQWKMHCHFGRSSLAETTKTTCVGIKFGIETISTVISVCNIFLVEYAWKMFSLRHFRIEIDTSLSVLVVSPRLQVALSFLLKPEMSF
jgi:hypothetical protein